MFCFPGMTEKDEFGMAGIVGVLTNGLGWATRLKGKPISLRVFRKEHLLPACATRA